MATLRARPMSDDHASLEEVTIAVAALTDADLARLGAAARLRARGLVGMAWQDLLHDAVDRALDGTRRWPTRVPFAVFLREVIRSLASEAWRLQSRHAEDEGEDRLALIPATTPDPEQATIAQDMVTALHRLFADDPIASGILDGIADELAPGEIQAKLGISQTGYDTARRRIRRRIAAAPEIFL